MKKPVASSSQSEDQNAFALKIIEVQYNTIRTEIEQYLARMFDVLKISLATVPILSGALIALVADQQTWSTVTERPILLGLFCLLSPMFVVIAIYLGTLGTAQYKALTRAGDYLKVHFEDYVFTPILQQLNRDKEGHVYEGARFEQFLFWENYLSQHEITEPDDRFRNNYDYDKHVMTAFLTLLCVSIAVISVICLSAFYVLTLQIGLSASAIQSGGFTWGVFEVLILVSFAGFASSLIWAIKSFSTFFRTIRTTGALKNGIPD